MERYLSFRIKAWRENIFTRRAAHLTGLLLCILFYSINANVLATFGHEAHLNDTIIVQCFATVPSTKWMDTWSNVILILLFFPFYKINNNKDIYTRFTHFCIHSYHLR